MSNCTGNENISVVIPIRNGQQHIGLILDSITKQDYPKEKTEVFFVDGNSDDNTGQLLREFINLSESIQNSYYRVEVINNPLQYVPFGLNKAIEQASFDTIIRMDAHSSYPENYLSEIVYWKNKLNAGNVGGITVAQGKSELGKAIAQVISSRFGMGNSEFRLSQSDLKPKKADTVPFGIFSKKILNEIGYFDTRYLRHQDYEMNYRIIQAGYNIFLIPTIKINYYVRDNYNSLFKQFYGYGFYKGVFLYNTKFKSLKIRHLMPVLLFVSIILGIILLLISPLFFQILGFSLFILPYMIFVFYAACVLSNKYSNRHFFKFFKIIPIMHLTYGGAVIIGFFLEFFEKFKLKM